ncbi:MAG: SpoIVB peptidase [Lachnospiraceae bacterium]|nr:SpoIVB peptidase [Lachnospiraceae bacterium]
MSMGKKYRRLLFVLLLLSLAFTSIYMFYEIRSSIPDQIYYCEDEEQPLEHLTENPLVTYSTEIQASGNGSYQINCQLMDLIPLKTVKAVKVERKSIYACAMPVGIYMETSGVLIVDAGEVKTRDEEFLKPAQNLVQPGDYIEKVDGTILENKKQLLEQVKQSQGNPLVLTLRRNGETIQQRLTPVLAADGVYRIGVWVRDNIQGIGTLTYLNQDGSYGALGHGISDVDIGDLLKLGSGELYQADILEVIRGRQGSPGELQGVIHYQEEETLGTIDRNTKVGIFGTISQEKWNQIPKKSCEIAMKQETVEGEASILCCINGEITEYQAKISKIDMSQYETNKCFQIEVTDQRLLEKTGGIVQGMSGSPILQNGKMIGAVTHVFVNDPTKGYGIFIETMLEQE